mgnify:CR=1 FL=1
MDSIVVDGIYKSYKGKVALEDISLRVREGEIYGLIGPDGAGKTTLFRILTTLSLADKGSASVCGLDVVKDYRKIRSQVGYMPGHFALYQDLSVEENLNFYATVFGTDVKSNYSNIKDIYSQLEMFRDRRAGALSGGMKQKLALCCALVHKPRVLFLDEPTTGVDAVSRREFWEMLSRIRESGVSIFVSTPYMDEASLCDRIAMITDGHIIGEGTPDSIRNGYPDTLYAAKGSDIFGILNTLRATEGIKSCNSFGSSCHVSVKKGGLDARSIEEILHQAGFADSSVAPIEAGIEDCFMNLS